MQLRRTFKKLSYAALSAAGLTYVHRRLMAAQLTVLTYHSFRGAAEHTPMPRQSIDLFAKQLRHLMHAYCIVPLADGVAEALSGQNSSKRNRPRLAITIDDGYRDTYALAFPLLRSLRVPATVFVSTDFTDTGRPPWTTRLREILFRTHLGETRWPERLDLSGPGKRAAAGDRLKELWAGRVPEERFELIRSLARELQVPQETWSKNVTWEQLSEMRRAGIEIGSHTVFHSILTLAGPSTLMFELLASRQRLEAELRCRCRTMAYPDGQANPEVATAARNAGYGYGLTQRPEPIRYGADPLLLGRVHIPHDEDIATFRSRASLLAASIARFKTNALVGS